MKLPCSWLCVPLCPGWGPPGYELLCVKAGPHPRACASSLPQRRFVWMRGSVHMETAAFTGSSPDPSGRSPGRRPSEEGMLALTGSPGTGGRHPFSGCGQAGASSFAEAANRLWKASKDAPLIFQLKEMASCRAWEGSTPASVSSC